MLSIATDLNTHSSHVFYVLVPKSAKVPLTSDEDISVAAFVIQDYWTRQQNSPVLEDWPNIIRLKPEEIDTVLTSQAMQSRKTRLARKASS